MWEWGSSPDCPIPGGLELNKHTYHTCKHSSTNTWSPSITVLIMSDCLTSKCNMWPLIISTLRRSCGHTFRVKYYPPCSLFLQVVSKSLPPQQHGNSMLLLPTPFLILAKAWDVGWSCVWRCFLIAVQTGKAVAVAEEAAATAVLSHVATGAAWFICLAPWHHSPLTSHLWRAGSSEQHGPLTTPHLGRLNSKNVIYLQIVITNIKRLI